MSASAKVPFDPENAIVQLRQAVAGLPMPSMFELRARGYRSLFQQIVACLISVRTYEEVSLPASIRLFERAPTAAEIAALDTGEIDQLISPATFHERKAVQILEIARKSSAEFDGNLPCDEERVLAFPGIGPKCAALALGIACEQERLPVDIHVHRVANRWGVVQTKTPEQTQLALERVFPPANWLELNERLVPFGKSICTRLRPRCSTCLLLDMCQQVGVTNPR
jgi:endonuclease-3